jgi:ATP-dependent RNA helicase RhlE
MLDMGFLPDIKRIMSKLPRARQSLFFSATLPPPVMKLAGELVHDPVQITISPEMPTVEKINQRVMFVPKSQKDSLLIHLLKEHPEWTKVIVFTKMRHGADRVTKKLHRENIHAAAIHSDKTQNQRVRALENFRRGENRVLVATDIASRGIDVPEVSAVINMELPLETESYVHRIGRTARAGESGAAISFVTADERGQLKAVERFIKKTIPIDRDHPFHSDEIDRKAGKKGDGLPQAEWVHPANRNRNNRKRQKHKGFQGRRQPDFGQKRT